MNMPFSIDKASFGSSLEASGVRKVAFVFHLTIKDLNDYSKLLKESENRFNSKRLFRVKADPVAREGMWVDEIIIDEFPSTEAALSFFSTFNEALDQVCAEYTVLAIKPEPAVLFSTVKAVSSAVRLFKGVSDKGTPTATWKAENDAVWPDENQMEVARAQHLDEPLFVYNLNKYKPKAEYNDAYDVTKDMSGKQAYDRYSKIAGFELLRRGAYPVYGGKPLGLFSSNKKCMLADRWDHFIFVRYPQRRNLLATIESEEFHKGEVHRDAGLERVAIFMAKG